MNAHPRSRPAGRPSRAARPHPVPRCAGRVRDPGVGGCRIRRHGAGWNPASARIRCPSGAGDQVDEARRPIPVGPPPVSAAIGYMFTHVRGLRERHRGDLVARRRCVGDVNQAGIRLAGLHLVQHVGDRRLLAHRRQRDARCSARSSRSPTRTAPAARTRPRSRRDLARSAKAAMPEGFPGGVTMVSVFAGEVHRLAGDAPRRRSPWSCCSVSAEANTSAGAPARICVTRSDEPAKLNVTVDPGFCCWYMPPRSR